jgi:hypothetical protein
MATFAPRENLVVTARGTGHKYKNIEDFKKTVDAWLIENNITYKWAGHHTHSEGEGIKKITYEYDLYVDSPQMRTFIALKWS